MTQLIFIDAKWDGDIELSNEVLSHLQKNNVKTLALFSSVQFTDIEKVKQQLLDVNIEPKITKAKRTNKELQILGCDIYHDSFNEDTINEADSIMYIGDGLFHPKALLLAQTKNEKIKDIILYDPMAKQFEILTEKNIEAQIQKLKRNLKMFISAKTIGILVTIKPGQQYFNASKRLKEHLESENKKAYIFIGDSIILNEIGRAHV